MVLHVVASVITCRLPDAKSASAIASVQPVTMCRSACVIALLLYDGAQVGSMDGLGHGDSVPAIGLAGNEGDGSTPLGGGAGCGTKVCAARGCPRYLLLGSHRHCCSLCGTGCHTNRCSKLQRALQEAGRSRHRRGIERPARFPPAAVSGKGFTASDGGSGFESATSGMADTDRSLENPLGWSVAHSKLAASSSASGMDALSAAAMDLALAAQSASSSPVVQGASSSLDALSTSEKLDLNEMD